MLSGFARFLFALAAISPVALIWAIVDTERRGVMDDRQAAVVVLALMIALACWALLNYCKRSLTKVSFPVSEIKAVDNEVVAYIVTYLFPLVAPSDGIGLIGQGAIVLVLGIVLATSNAFTFNPVLTLLGYRFYEAKTEAGITYLLVSKSDITDVKSVKSVGLISTHLVLQID